MEASAPFFYGSLSEVLEKLTDWKYKRYGLSSPRPFFQKISRSWSIVSKNKISFILLLLLYFIGEIIGNTIVLICLWTLNPSTPKTPTFIVIQLTSSWLAKLWRSILSTSIIYVILSAVKRRGHDIFLNDIFAIKNHLSFKFVLSIFVITFLLTSPIAIAQALFSVEFLWSLVYIIFGLLFNAIFGMAQILIIEDPSISLFSCFVWSASAALSPSTFTTVLLSYLIGFILTFFIITEPLALVLQMLTFFEVFGYSSPAEVHYTTQLN